MKYLSLLLLSVISLQGFSQNLTPKVINYQSCAAGTGGTPLPNQLIGLRFTIHDISQSGTIVFQETDTVTTNPSGNYTIGIGAGTIVQDSIAGINWGSGNKYLQIELDPNGGNNYNNVGTTLMASSPYAQNAQNAGNWYDYANYDEEVASGSSPATTLSDSNWVARQIGNTLDQAGLSISRSGANITLQPGTYYISASAQWGIKSIYNLNVSGIGYETWGVSQLRLRNTTSNTTALIALGQNFYLMMGNGNGATFRQPFCLSLEGVITVTSTSTFNLQHFITYANNNGDISVDAGAPVSVGDNEVYSRILIRRIL
jgi:hypothetical protein